MSTPREIFIQRKLKKIHSEGIRKNTKEPVSASNTRGKVSNAQAYAVALNTARKAGYRIPNKS